MLPSLFHSAQMASWGVPDDQLSEKKETCAWLSDDTAKVDSCSTTAPPQSTVVRGKSLSGQNFNSTACCLLAWKEKCPDVQLDTESQSVTNGLAGWSGNEKEYNWKIGDGKVEGRGCMWIGPF